VLLRCSKHAPQEVFQTGLTPAAGSQASSPE
jgi:hypothetical protein